MTWFISIPTRCSTWSRTGPSGRPRAWEVRTRGNSWLTVGGQESKVTPSWGALRQQVCAWKALEGRRGEEKRPPEAGMCGQRNQRPEPLSRLPRNRSLPCSGHQPAMQKKMRLLQNHFAEPDTSTPDNSRTKATRGPTLLTRKDAKNPKEVPSTSNLALPLKNKTP